MSETQFLVFPLSCSSSAFPGSVNGISIFLVARLKTLESSLTTPFLQYPLLTHPDIYCCTYTVCQGLTTSYHYHPRPSHHQLPPYPTSNIATASNWSFCYCPCTTAVSSWHRSYTETFKTFQILFLLWSNHLRVKVLKMACKTLLICSFFTSQTPSPAPSHSSHLSCYFSNMTHAPSTGLCPGILSAWNTLCPNIHLPYSTPLSSLYPNVTFSVRHTLTTLFKIVIHISLPIPSTSDSSYSALYFIFHNIYHLKTCGMIYLFICLLFILPPPHAGI